MLEGDIVQMGAYIGAGLACTGMGGAAVGVGHVVGTSCLAHCATPLRRVDKQLLCLSASRSRKLWGFSLSSLRSF